MKNLKLKIVFISTPEFGAIILERLCKANLKPVLAVTAPDKPVGRKQILTPSPVKIVAKKYDIPVEKAENTGRVSPDLAIVAAYSKILSKEVLSVPKYGSLNVHPSLLPKYRGPSPIQYAILNGDKETGVTIMLMDEKVDHGPILAQKKAKIGPSETAEQLHDKLAEMGADLLIKTIPEWIKGEIKPETQEESKATYTKILTREDGKIDWEKPPQAIERQIRAFTPWPGSYTIYNGKILKILKAELSKQQLIIKEVQPEGKKPMAFEDFLRGHPDFKVPC